MSECDTGDLNCYAESAVRRFSDFVPGTSMASMASCTVNGKKYEIPDGLADSTLLEWLRGAPLKLVSVVCLHAQVSAETNGCNLALLEGEICIMTIASQ